MNKYKCQSCGFNVYNRRYAKCEACGVLLAPGIALSTEERADLFEKDRVQADADWRERERKRLDELKNNDGGAPYIPPL